MTSVLVRCHPLISVTLLRFQLNRVPTLSFSNDTKHIEIDKQFLLSEENQQRCLEKMGRAPPVGIKLRGAKSESKFAAVLIALCTDENM